MHWADHGTADLLRFLVSDQPEELCLVLTYRREDLGSSSALVDLTARLAPGIVRNRIVSM